MDNWVVHQNPTHWFTTLNSVKNNHRAATRETVLSASSGRPMSASRRAILTLLRDQPEAVPQRAIEQHTGLHGNTIREHLVALVESGQIRRFSDQPNGRGRPVWLYESATDPDRDSHANWSSPWPTPSSPVAPNPPVMRFAQVSFGVQQWLWSHLYKRANHTIRSLPCSTSLASPPNPPSLVRSNCTAARCWGPRCATRMSFVRCISGSREAPWPSSEAIRKPAS